MKKQILAILTGLAILATAGCGSSNKLSEDGATEVFGNEKGSSDTTEKYITISLGGNVALSSLQSDFSRTYKSKGEGYFFENIKTFFEDDDLTIVNLDNTFSNDNEDEYRAVADTSYTGILKAGGIDAVSLANEYADTLGKVGLESTKAALDEAEIDYVTDAEAKLIEVNGVSVGLIGIYVDDEYADAEKRMSDAFDSFESSPDVTVVILHWETSDTYTTTSNMKKLAHKAVDMGATLVAGTHPYPIHGIEKYNGSVICYSLGNLCYGFGECEDDYKDSFIYRQTFTLGADGKLLDDDAYEIIPINVSSDEDENTFRPTPAEPKVRMPRIEQTINDACEALGGSFIPYFNEDFCKSSPKNDEDEDEAETEDDGEEADEDDEENDTPSNKASSKTVTSDNGEKVTVTVE